MIERTVLPVEQRRVVYTHDFYSVHLREDFSGLFLDRALYKTVVLYSDQGAIIKQMVANGRYASFEALHVPKGTGDSRIVRIPFSPEWHVTIVFVWKKNIELSRVAKKFIEFARNYDYSSIEYEN